jgi:hypothetical protein
LTLKNRKPFNIDSAYYFYKGAIDTIDLYYQINNGNIISETWTGTLALNDSLNFNFATLYKITKGRVYNIKAWAKIRKSLTELFPENDTLKKVLSIPMAGVYTIGGIAPDYNEVKEVVNDLYVAGGSAPVDFRIRPGFYVVGNMAYTNPKPRKSVIYQSESHKNTDVFLELKTVYESKIVFRNLTILPRSTYSNMGVMIIGDSVVIDSCIFRGGKESVQRNGITYLGHSSRLIASNCHFSNFDRGIEYSGVQMAGGFSDYFDNKNYIINNVFDSVKSCILMDGVIDTLYITNNLMKNHLDYGVYSYNPSVVRRCFISKNTITGAVKSGMYFYGLNGSSTVDKSFIIYNNFISASGIYAINIDGKYNKFKVFNNSMYGSFFSLNADSLSLFNNIIYSPTIQPAVVITMKQGMYLGYTSDHNAYYAPNSTHLFNNFFHTYTSLNDLIAGTLQDSSSLSLDPMFTSITDLHAASLLLAGAAMPIPFITDDIDGELRDPFAPDIGADEFNFLPVSTYDNRSTTDIDLKIFPNPYSGYVHITYELKTAAKVKIEVYDMLGKIVKVIRDGSDQAGQYKHSFSAAEIDRPAGIYFIKALIDNKQTIRKIIEIR